jgi:hypothetical protein
MIMVVDGEEHDIQVARPKIVFCYERLQLK